MSTPTGTVTRRSLLHAALSAHRPADATERGHLERMRALIAAAGDPFAREHHVPGHFTASAFVLAPDADALLLILHAKLDRWLQPGGHVDPDDRDLLAAARREVAEEAGLTELALAHEGVFDVDVHVIPARASEPAHEHFDVRFLLRARTREVSAASDARAARWVPLTEMACMPTDASVLRAVAKLRAREGR